MGKLSFAKIKALRTPGRYGDGGTLFLNVAPGGSKSWVQRLTVFRGSAGISGLGGWPLLSLAAARVRAFENRKVARIDDGDPLAGKRRAKMRTFEQVAREAHQANRERWSRKHAFNWLSSLERFAFPVLGADAGGQGHGARRPGRPGADPGGYGPAGAATDPPGPGVGAVSWSCRKQRGRPWDRWGLADHHNPGQALPGAALWGRGPGPGNGRGFRGVVGGERPVSVSWS